MRKSEKITSYIDNAYMDAIKERNQRQKEKDRQEAIGPDAERRKNLPKLINEIMKESKLSLREAIIELIKSEYFQKEFGYLISAKGMTEEKIIQSLEHRYKAMTTGRSQGKI